MYITVMDFSTSTVTTLACNFELADSEAVESLLECCGYHLSQISYMTSNEEPEVSTIKISDILSDETMKEIGQS